MKESFQMREGDIEVGMMLSMLNRRNRGGNLGTEDGAGSYFSLLGFKNAIGIGNRKHNFPKKKYDNNEKYHIRELLFMAVSCDSHITVHCHLK